MIFIVFCAIGHRLYVGAGIYADLQTHKINPRPIANNGLIVSASNGIGLYCVSNSSQSGVGTIITSNGETLHIGYDAGLWRVQNPGNRPGVLHVQNRIESMIITASDQGIYTCTIPDDNGNEFIFNVGLYPIDFNGNYLYTFLPENHLYPPQQMLLPLQALLTMRRVVV